MDAVYAFAYALIEWQTEYCGNETGLCDKLKEAKIEELRDILLEVNFTGELWELSVWYFPFFLF